MKSSFYHIDGLKLKPTAFAYLLGVPMTIECAPIHFTVTLTDLRLVFFPNWIPVPPLQGPGRGRTPECLEASRAAVVF